MMSRLLFILLVGISITACKKDDSAPSFIDFGYDYLPLKVGMESVFQIDSIKYDDFNNKVDTLSFQRRERITSSFLDLEQRLVYRVEIDIRQNETASWIPQKVVTKYKNELRYELFEDNLRTIPLVFPVSENRSWNANLLNIEDELRYNYEQVDQFFRLNDSISYDSTLNVIQRSEENLIEVFRTSERYAKGVGLIYRRDVKLETELDGSIKSGYDVTIQLSRYLH